MKTEEILEYIKDGLVELCENYNIKGIIYDDYFYPSIDCDLEEYNVLDLDISYEEYKLIVNDPEGEGFKPWSNEERLSILRKKKIFFKYFFAKNPMLVYI